MKEIAKLKQYIAESKTLSEPINYFFDLIDKNIILQTVGSCKISNIANHPILCTAITIAIEMANKTLKKKIHIHNQVFTEIPQEKFFHGYCILEDHPIPLLILYCADLQVGISALADLHKPTNFFRFSLATINELNNQH